MKVLLNSTFALGAVLALVGIAGSSATAQSWGNYRRSDNSNSIRRERQEIETLQRVYDREMRLGNRQAAWRAHLKAERLRERIREQRRHDRWPR